MKHLDKNIFIDLLELKTIPEEIKNHFSVCDSCLIKYTSIKSDYDNLMTTETEQTPNQYLRAMRRKFNLNKKENSLSLIDKLTNLFNFKDIPIFSKNRIAVPVGIATLAAIAVFIYSPSSKNSLKQSYFYADYRAIASQGLNSNPPTSPLSFNKEETSADFKKLTKQSFPESPPETRLLLKDFRGMKKEQIVEYAKKSKLQLYIEHGNKFSQMPEKRRII